MLLLEDGVIASLAAAGLAAVICLALRAVRPRCRGTLDAVAVVPCCGSGERLEQTVRALEALRSERGGFSRIVILDCGLDGEAGRIAQLLCREGADVALCDRAALIDEIG